MTIQPSGHVRTTDAGRDLVLVRIFRASIDDVWASLTEPDRFARWYGTLEGETGVGRTVTVAMTAEEQVVEEPATILECDPPTRLVVELGGQQPPWHLTVDLAEADGVTTMTFTHALAADVDVTDIGPGWEFYADRFTAALEGAEKMPDWEADGYQAALAPHYGG